MENKFWEQVQAFDMKKQNSTDLLKKIVEKYKENKFSGMLFTPDKIIIKLSQIAMFLNMNFRSNFNWLTSVKMENKIEIARNPNDGIDYVIFDRAVFD